MVSASTDKSSQLLQIWLAYQMLFLYIQQHFISTINMHIVLQYSNTPGIITSLVIVHHINVGWIELVKLSKLTIMT